MLENDEFRMTNDEGMIESLFLAFVSIRGSWPQMLLGKTGDEVLKKLSSGYWVVLNKGLFWRVLGG